MKKISIECSSLWESLKKTAYSLQKKDLEKAARPYLLFSDDGSGAIASYYGKESVTIKTE